MGDPRGVLAALQRHRTTSITLLPAASSRRYGSLVRGKFTCTFTTRVVDEHGTFTCTFTTRVVDEHERVSTDEARLFQFCVWVRWDPNRAGAQALVMTLSEFSWRQLIEFF